MEKLKKDRRKIRVAIRYASTKKDLPSILEIEFESFQFQWSGEDFINALKQKNCCWIVATLGTSVLGFVVYEFSERFIHILDFAVAKDSRRRGVGTQMIADLIGKLSPAGRRRIILEVRETNLAAQLFFRSCGFRAIRVVRGYFEEVPDEDVYFMQYRWRQEKKEDQNKKPK